MARKTYKDYIKQCQLTIKCIFLGILFVTSSAFAVENNIYIAPSWVKNQEGYSHSLNIDYQIIKKVDDIYCLLNPRLDFLMKGKYSTGLGLGIRKDLGQGLAGFHFFGDYSYLYKSHHFQIGPSLEYIHPKWDLTVNYYLPLSKSSEVGDILTKSIHYIDGSAFYKMRYCDVGIEPSYNWATKTFGLVGHASVPTQFGNINLSVGRNSRHGDHANVGVSFPIYSCIKNTHNSKVRRSTGVMHHRLSIPPVVVKIEEMMPLEPVEPIIPVVIPEEPIEQDSQGWWDYLFGWMVVDKVDGPEPSIYDWVCDYSYSDSDDYSGYSYTPAEDAGAVTFEVSNGHSSDMGSPLSEGASPSMGDVGTPPEFSPVTDYANMSDSAFIESVGEILAADGGYSITVDSSSDGAGSLDVSVDFSPDVSSNIGNSDTPDSVDGFDIIGQNSPYSTGH